METTEITPLTRSAIATLLNGREVQSPDAGAHARRAAPRWPFPGTVELWVPEADGSENYTLGTCVNLSLDGLGMLCDEELPANMELAIAIHQPEMSFHGRAIVRHTTRNAAGYYTGLQFVFEKRKKAAK